MTFIFSSKFNVSAVRFAVNAVVGTRVYFYLVTWAGVEPSGMYNSVVMETEIP